MEAPCSLFFPYQAGMSQDEKRDSRVVPLLPSKVPHQDIVSTGVGVGGAPDNLLEKNSLLVPSPLS